MVREEEVKRVRAEFDSSIKVTILSVYRASPFWGERVRFRAEVDGFIPGSHNVYLRIVREGMEHEEEVKRVRAKFDSSIKVGLFVLAELGMPGAFPVQS